MTVTTTVNPALDHVDYDLIEHRRTVTAAEEARAIGVRPEQIAKTIVLASDQRYIRAVLPASEHIDMHKVRRVLGDNRARFATECELAVAYPMYELGAVPPFGVPAGDRVIFDRRLTQWESLLLKAGSHKWSLRMKTADLLNLTQVEIEDIAESRSGR